jgi:3'-phosphoadenosine 5'-phosphosulfate sulfotransferase (PAPS reductase)/FAD synthetase
MIHVIAFSGGKDSTVLALRLAEIEPRDYVLVCTPTGDELPEWHEHMKRIAGAVGEIKIVTSGLSLKSLVEREKMIPNHRARFCTRILKIDPYRTWLRQQVAEHGGVVSYVGLRADEEGRAGGAYDDIGGVTMRFPMREWGWGIADVQKYLQDRGIVIPRGNCARCYEQRLGEWWTLWKEHPEIYADAEAEEIRIGHTWRSPSRDTWPAALKDLRTEFERGKVPQNTERQFDMLSVGQCRVCSL